MYSHHIQQLPDHNCCSMTSINITLALSLSLFFSFLSMGRHFYFNHKFISFSFWYINDHILTLYHVVATVFLLNHSMINNNRSPSSFPTFMGSIAMICGLGSVQVVFGEIFNRVFPNISKFHSPFLRKSNLRLIKCHPFSVSFSLWP